jgi:hypothetical protein
VTGPSPLCATDFDGSKIVNGGPHGVSIVSLNVNRSVMATHDVVKVADSRGFINDFSLCRRGEPSLALARMFDDCLSAPFLYVTKAGFPIDSRPCA